ncbi:hypothetical protein GCM10010145_07360 [Streptomyces ruber]|uniref:Uncharacterized protein n=2 Tax=Streptomyces TaxID=1883 RepID=A0A918B7Q1_9ACTN|nr:hypothetical protein GCM10010145_07360 [Streptomyces ruber]
MMLLRREETVEGPAGSGGIDRSRHGRSDYRSRPAKVAVILCKELAMHHIIGPGGKGANAPRGVCLPNPCGPSLPRVPEAPGAARGHARTVSTGRDGGPPYG